MPEPVFCGVDIGTTHVKAALVSPAGSVVGVARAPTPVTSDGVGACHDPEQIRETAEAVVRAAQETAGGAPVAAIGVTSVGEEGVPLGPSWSVLYPAIAWHERRSSDSATWWDERHTGEDRFAVTGLHPSLWSTVYKWLWLKEERPDAWRECRTWLGLADYVMWRWTGNRGMSLGHASRTGLLDLGNLRWHEAWADEVLARGAATLPPLLSAGSPLGSLLPGVIEGMAREREVPVVVTGHDHAVGGYAAGVARPGQLLDSMGTAEALVEVVPEGLNFAEFYRTGIDFGTGITPGTRTALFGLESGAGIEAMRRMASSAPADDVGPGADGLRYLPPRPGSPAGAFFGHRVEHGAEHFNRAVIEGWSLAADAAVRALGAHDRITEVVCIGGGSSHELWTRVKASVMELDLLRAGTPEAVAVGAALLAGGLQPVARTDVAIPPVCDWVPAYRELREEYAQLTQLLLSTLAAPRSSAFRGPGRRAISAAAASSGITPASIGARMPATVASPPPARAPAASAERATVR